MAVTGTLLGTKSPCVVLMGRLYVAVTESTWLLQDLRGSYGVNVHSFAPKSPCMALTGRLYVAVTVSTWLLQGLRGSDGAYVAFIGSMWMLRG